MSDTRPVSTSNPSPGKISLSSSSTNEVSSSIAEQIRQILSTNILKPNSSTGDSTTQSVLTKNSLDKLSDIVKVEHTNTNNNNNNNVKETTKDFSQQQQQQQKIQSNFPYTKNEAVPVVVPPFNYTSSSVSTPASMTPFVPSNFPPYNSVTPSLTLNSTLKPSTSLPVPNFVPQSSQYFYPIPTQNIYQTPLNSTTAADTTAAAILQAYSQFNVQPTTTPSIINQQLTTQQQQQQQQIRK